MIRELYLNKTIGEKNRPSHYYLGLEYSAPTTITRLILAYPPYPTLYITSSLKPFYSRSRTGAPSFHTSFISSITALTS